ncbi:unnamed protein product [Rotaria socialis]|uniref:ABC transporter domain-containing protein n=1 Tax=Rotaria socialis TaxID=392032 RepID=A0A820QEJ4_9BILA|nr:unnamed protein product [Rotaria socialis]CAF4417651.1 unnamed protein product [Rotaria socialis]CAF4481071.1 unnamed protein product [Rotaria socialis]
MNSFSSLNNDVTKQWDLETLNNETIERETLLSSISINTTTEQDDTAQNIIVPNHRTASVSRVSISADAAATLSFHDINYFIGDKIEPSKHRLNFPSRSCLKSQEYKQILFNISGIFSNGMNAILGPTGCGKSSLLDILADRKDQHGLSGRILVDGLPRHPSFKYIVGYVVQEDIFTGTLTVRENLLFSANLRLPKTVSTLEKNARVLRIITELGLESCADTRMGTDFLRGVSGGEKKRTCIGMELVLSPKILFLDEPTTGLDASTANNVMSYLKKLSDEGRTIVFSIHQPRYSIFKLFDSVIFMCKGECVYHGPINNIETYFSTLGYQCKLHDNPTDFVLDILIDAHRTPETLTKLNDAYKQSSMHIDVLARAQQEDNTENQELFQSTIVVEAAQALRTEIFYVSQRTLRNALRNPAMALAQVVVSIMIGFLVGLVFYDLKKTTDPGIQDRLGTIFFIVVNQIFSTVALIIVVLIYVGMMVFSGFLIKLTSMFNWLSWIQWISAFRYASNVLTINEFQGLKLCLPNQTDVCPVMGEDVLNDRGIDHGTAWDLWKNFFALTMMTTIVFVLAYIRLLRIKKTK